MQILVADNVPFLRRTLGKYLEGFGYENVILTGSLEDALRYLESSEIDLVITDLSLATIEFPDPNKRGYILAEKARDFSVPCIAVSSVWDEASVEMDLAERGVLAIVVRSGGYREILKRAIEEAFGVVSK